MRSVLSTRTGSAGPGLVRSFSPTRAAVVGAIATCLIAAAIAPLGDAIGHAAQALLLVIPVAATAVVGGRRPAEIVAGVATLMFTLILPPVGTLHIRFAEDAVALAVFTVVAFTVGGLVAHRIEALDQLEKQRAALLRSVSHDLRTPLSAIRASVSELEDGSMYDDATRTRLLYLVGEEADRLDRLVANLLSLARIEGGGLSPRRVAVDLPELVRLCTHRLDRVLDDIEVRIDAPTDLPTVFADHTLVEQVVTNLLENAARHSPPGTPIIVRLRALRKTLELAVIDHGAGVRAGDSKVIFEPFRSGTSGGTSGIGLAICKAVVEAHGGTIGVDETPGGGATFTVRLPIG